MGKVTVGDAMIEPENESNALAAFAATVRAHYGERLNAIVLFGSRARNDARPDSDADVAVILADGSWNFWAELRILADFAYDALIRDGLSIHAWPLAQAEWDDPGRNENPRFVANVKRDAKPLPVAA